MALPRLLSVVFAATTLVLACHGCHSDPGSAPSPPPPTPVIVVTDLYHPYEDVGDNLDLLTPFGLPEIDLRAVILDVTEEYLHPVAFPNEPDFTDATGPREPGFVPVKQLDSIFGRSVPFAVGVYTPMRSFDDRMLDAPAEQQRGIELLLQTLRESPSKVTIVSTGSVRPLALAYNREPALMMDKVERIHVAAGASAPPFLEWNVHLDPKAFAALLRSPLPIALYPCATSKGALDLGTSNTFWSLTDLSWFADTARPIRAYVYFALTRSPRTDFLAAMDEEPDPTGFSLALVRPHNVWETALWLQVSKRRLVKHAATGAPGANDFEIVKQSDVRSDDEVIAESLRPARVTVADDGILRIDPDPSGTSHVLVYERSDPERQQTALRAAVPGFFRRLGDALKR